MGSMKHTSLLRASVLASISLTFAGGCGAKKDAQPSTEGEKPIPLLAGVDAPKPVLNSLDRTDDAGTDALARTTASYADQMEQMLAARANEAAAAQASAAPAAPAEVPQEPTISNQPVAIAPEPAPSPSAPPAAAATAKASQVEFADAATLPPVDSHIATDPASQIPAAQVRTVARTNEVKTPPPVPQPSATEQLAANISGPAVTPQVSTAGSDEPDGALERKFAQRVKDYPRDVGAHLDYQLLQFVQDKSVPDLNAIAPLPAEDREVLTAMLDGLSNFRNTVRADNNALLSKKIAPVVAMADRLRASANLSIPTVSLCTAVQQFGVYTPVESPRFKAGVDNQVILYCEVANFASHLNGRGMWETKLTYETALYTDDDAGLPVWQGKPTPIVDECRNRRHDFFLADKIALPANLPVGRFLMKVSIVDQHANRIAEATVPLQLVILR
jgi:hypothetical protein